MPLTITWDDEQVALARWALSACAYTVEHGPGRAVVAGMLADLGVQVPEKRSDEEG